MLAMIGESGNLIVSGSVVCAGAFPGLPSGTAFLPPAGDSSGGSRGVCGRTPHEERVLERAKKILDRRFGLDEPAAFRALQLAAMNRRLSVPRVAELFLDGRAEYASGRVTVCSGVRR